MHARSWSVILLSSLLGLACPASPRTAQAQEVPSANSSWWNPMTWGASASDPSVRSSTYFNSESTKAKSKQSAWSLPKFAWGAAEKEAAARPTQPRSPNVLKKMGQSTRQAWHNTTDFFNPFNDGPVSPKNSGYPTQNVGKNTSSSGGGMFDWLRPKEPVEEPTSVNDWLAQERPRF